jgi:hypothetical protein
MTGTSRQYRLVTTHSEALQIIAAIAESGQVHALDFETTGLRPGEADVRLTCICGPAGNYVFFFPAQFSFISCVPC